MVGAVGVGLALPLEFLYFPRDKLTWRGAEFPLAGWNGRTPRFPCMAVPPHDPWACNPAPVRWLACQAMFCASRAA
jgi:hypothetical protein